MTMARFEFHATLLAGLKVVQRQVADDDRGFFSRLFCADEFVPAGWALPIAQINHSMTRTQGALRGLHFQRPPHADMKLVSCLRGEVFDVAVDLRRGSPTFLRWHAQTLSAENLTSLLVPKGFAHGFQTLRDDCEMVYLHSAPYAAHAEAGLHANDPRLAIAWPLPAVHLSPRDAGFAPLDDCARGVPA